MKNGKPVFTITDKINQYTKLIIDLINDIDQKNGQSKWKTNDLCSPIQNENTNDKFNGNVSDMQATAQFIKNMNYLDFNNLLLVHKYLTLGQLSDGGIVRTAGESIYSKGKVIYRAPNYEQLNDLYKDLYDWLKNCKLNFLIASSIFHFELLWIHGFGDGNGRTSRTMQHIILCQYHPIFTYVLLPILIKDTKRQHSAFWIEHPMNEDSTAFIEYILELIYNKILNFKNVIEDLNNKKQAK